MWGKPYDWGVALGTLYKDETTPFITSMWTYMESQIESALKHFPAWLQKVSLNKYIIFISSENI